MSRGLSARFAAVMPLRTHEVLPPGYDERWVSSREGRKPVFVPGDVVRCLHEGHLMWALVVHAWWFRGETTGDWIPEYKVRVRLKNGDWSKLWLHLYPHQIQQAYLAAAKPQGSA